MCVRISGGNVRGDVWGNNWENVCGICGECVWECEWECMRKVWKMCGKCVKENTEHPYRILYKRITFKISICGHINKPE